MRRHGGTRPQSDVMMISLSRALMVWTTVRQATAPQQRRPAAIVLLVRAD